MPMTCQHNVAVGAWCRYCGAAVDSDLVRAFALAPEVTIPAQLARACGNCSRPLLVRSGQWTTCGACGTQTTALP
jgi:hypothetical protein